jgi:uncharacterized protein (DUF58 family)
VLALALVGLGLLLGSPWLWRLGLIVAAVGLVAMAWARLALAAVRYERVLSTHRVFAGETLDLTVRLANDKLLPLTWLRVEDSVPDALTVAGRPMAASSRVRSLALLHAASLAPYERLTWRYSLRCPRRGVYAFGPVALESGDPFGLYRARRELALADRLVVFPVLRPLADYGLPAGAPLGERRDPHALARDPLQPVGVRPYEPGDSRRAVSWPATARLGALQVKVLEPTSQTAVMVVLNVATFDPAWIGVDPEVQERLIEVAASVCLHALAARRPVGLAANAAPPGSGRVARLPPGNHPGARAELLELLAGVTAFVSLPVERLVSQESRRAPWGATLVVVTAVVPEALSRALLRLRRAGRRVVLVSLDPAFTGRLPGVTTYHAGPPPFAPDGAAPGWHTSWLREVYGPPGVAR